MHVDSSIASPPELLAPAGEWDCVRAAVENGADAVYFGLDAGFNARARATNFSVDDLPELMEYLHRRCVRGYVTMNTLAFTDELPRVADSIRLLADAGVDAILVQDLGVAQLARQIAPTLALHASTQMTLTSAECIDVIRDLGIERVVLPRELSIDEIRKVSASTDMTLEAFVHGALCVAYSGQCLTSESLGGRSANRGQCAQACRLPYDLICDGEDVELGDQKYLLSPQDLAAFDLTRELMDAGVSSFKIEGRLKTPEYVANTVQHYRRAIDEAVAGRAAEFSRQEVNDLEMSFSRGFSPGWLGGCDHKMLVPALSSAKRGVLLGEVVSCYAGRISVRLETSVAAGDGVVFEGDRANDDEQGGRVFEIFKNAERVSGSVDGGVVNLTFDNNAIDFDRLREGLKVWKTDDPRLNKRLRASFESADARRRVAVDLTVVAKTGEVLTVSAAAANGATCSLTTDAALEQARKHVLSEETLREQFGRLGATIYELRDLTAEIDGGPMVPLSVLGQLRRRMIESLDGHRVTKNGSHEHEAQVSDPRPPNTSSPVDSLALRAGIGAEQQPPKNVSLNVLCRSLGQLRELLNLKPSTVYVDFADIRQYGEAVQLGRDAGVKVFLATPRIQKPGEMGLFRVMLKHRPDGVLARNLSGIAFFHGEGIPVVADFSLNCTNEYTADYLMRLGVERVTASYDMNRDQLLELCDVVPPHWLEVVIHQHMPMFHMEHCVFCSVLSPGTNKTNCGRPCDDHNVEMRDRIGLEHPLTADVGCRNTLFNATPQSSAEVTPVLLERGIRSFRIELLNDDAERIRETVSLYRRLLDGSISSQAVWKALHASNRVGVTRGTLEERRNPLAIL